MATSTITKAAIHLHRLTDNAVDDGRGGYMRLDQYAITLHWPPCKHEDGAISDASTEVMQVTPPHRVAHGLKCDMQQYHKARGIASRLAHNMHMEFHDHANP